MRYTRNRQIKKVNEDYYHELVQKNIRIDIIRKHPYIYNLDETFKWHRDFEGWGENWIEFGGDNYSYGELICVKGKNLHLK